MPKSKRGFDLKRISVAEQIKQELVRRIANGQLPPGTRLTELSIAEEFRTSQGPVREALRQLEVMDIVETQPYKGTYVRAVSIQDMKDAYAVRAPLEQLIGELAAKQLMGNVGEISFSNDFRTDRARFLIGRSRHLRQNSGVSITNFRGAVDRSSQWGIDQPIHLRGSQSPGQQVLAISQHDRA